MRLVGSSKINLLFRKNRVLSIILKIVLIFRATTTLKITLKLRIELERHYIELEIRIYILKLIFTISDCVPIRYSGPQIPSPDDT